MSIYRASQLTEQLLQHGRTFYDAEREALFFNWTCSGFSVTFHGTYLRAEILSCRTELQEQEGAQTGYPWIGVVEGDGNTLAKRIECREEKAWYSLYEGGENGLHTLRLVKLSENAYGKTGLLMMETDGEVVLHEQEKQNMSIEFIGDSITCGYGNEASGRDAPFLTAEENGWITYGALAARALGAEFSCISTSGISVAAPKYNRFPMPVMNEIYEHTDYYCDTYFGRKPAPWDFEKHKKDIVVLNLGTNDSLPVWSYTDVKTADEEEVHFCVKYREFLETLRRCNGSDTWICCTLGPLDFYLYDRIRETVESYCRETEDRRVCCFKLIGVNLLTEGYGAAAHPSAKTHERMGRELAKRLWQIVQEGRPDRVTGWKERGGYYEQDKNN